MEKRWQFGRPDSGLIQAFTEQLHISPVLAQVLANRGIADAGEASHFLHDTLADMADPFLMKGMDAAVQRLEQAITENQRIVIYGDYSSYGAIQKFIEDNGYELVSGGFERIPNVDLKEVTPEQATTLEKLTNLLEDDDDVTAVYNTMKPLA